MPPTRTSAAGLSLSAAGLITLLVFEGFSPIATVPVETDIPTVGFGSTVIAGQPVTLGEKIDPVRALVVASEHISAAEKSFRRSIQTVALSQSEYDAYMDFVYQYGIGTWQTSSMRNELLAGNYEKACDALLRYRFSGGYDCSTLENGQPNRRCYGVWQRQQKRHKQCLGSEK